VTLGVAADEAKRSADVHRRRLASRDPFFAVWASASTGAPIVVATVGGEPSYWVVPVEAQGRAIGFVRVGGDGSVAAAGALYRDPTRLDACPAVVTGLTAADARRATAREAGVREEDVGPPVYVHDGPPGREAWLTRVRTGGDVRSFLVTTGGVDEGPAGGG
jgi:hypothetical protein